MTDKIEDKFITRPKFSKLIETEVYSNKMSYMDAIIHLCEQHNIELEDCRKYLSPTVKGKLEVEAMNLNFLPKKATLPGL